MLETQLFTLILRRVWRNQPARELACGVAQFGDSFVSPRAAAEPVAAPQGALVGQSTQSLNLSDFQGRLHVHDSRYGGMQMCRSLARAGRSSARGISTPPFIRCRLICVIAGSVWLSPTVSILRCHLSK